VGAFKFNLQPVLDQRERIEDDRKLAVAKLESERAALESQLRGYQEAITAQKGDLRSSMALEDARGVAVVDPGRLKVQAHASLTMQVRAQRVVLMLAGLHRRLETARAALAVAARDRRAVEVLRDRRFARWKAENDRREAAAIDEMGSATGPRRAGMMGEAFDDIEAMHG